MDYYAGIDVSLELSSVCILDASGQIVREAKVASEPEALRAFLASLNLPLTRVGLEAGPLSQWLHAGLVQTRIKPLGERTRFQSDPGERQLQAGEEGGKRLRLAGNLRLADDLSRAIEDADAAEFQRHVNSGIVVHGCPS